MKSEKSTFQQVTDSGVGIMKKNRNCIAALLIAAVISLGVSACGTGNGDVLVDNGANPIPSANVFIKTGTISTDSWGYTGSSSVLLAAPAQTEIAVAGHTLLVDASQSVVSGTINTKVSYSSDITTLTAAIQSSAPANFVSYVNISMESAKRAIQPLSVTVDVGTVLAGKVLSVLNYDTDSGKRTSAQTATVNSSGKITFPVNRLSLWGIFQ
jgi:hypothetical protein